jgi:hypothetical protein
MNGTGSISIIIEPNDLDYRLQDIAYELHETRKGKITVLLQCFVHFNKYELFLNIRIQLTTQIYSKLNVVRIIKP